MDKNKKLKIKDFYSKELEKEYEKYSDFYFKNNAIELKKIVNKILANNNLNFTNDEAYELSTDIFVNEVLPFYDSSKGDFGGWLYHCLKMKLITALIANNRQKRTAHLQGSNGALKDKEGNIIKSTVMSLDMTMNEDTDTTIGDTIESKQQIEVSEKVDNYLSVLSGTQKKIAKMLMQNYTSKEIQQELNISQKEYGKAIADMRSYDKKKLLKREESNTTECIMEEKNMQSQNTTMERNKNTSYSIASISKKLSKTQIKDNHVLQRSSGMWKMIDKSELVSDVLQGNTLTPIIISEEIKNGVAMHWLIDGKQRCTNLDDYLQDGFKVSKNVQRYEIAYQTEKRDENGDMIFNEDGFPIMESRVFDIRNKLFSQLPEELQDKFKDYQVPVMLNLNCTKSDIAYDIARFNRSRPMTKSQNGWTGLDENFAELVDGILKMQFFKADCDKSSYTETNFRNGDMRRIIVESIMLSKFEDDYNKDFRKMCEYLTEEANDSVFSDFYILVDRLSHVATYEISKLFTTKDSAMWFTIFSKFTELNIEDSKFVDFASKFSKEMEHIKEELKINDLFAGSFVDKDTYKKLTNTDTKNKVSLHTKIDIIMSLMLDYLHINKEETNTKEITDEEFISEVVEINLDEVKEDIELYSETLDDLLMNCVRDGSKLLEDDNRQSLLALVAYSYKWDKEIDGWLEEYAKNNNTYNHNKKENYLHMVECFEKYENEV